jgi:hypothetical protein
MSRILFLRGFYRYEGKRHFLGKLQFFPSGRDSAPYSVSLPPTFWALCTQTKEGQSPKLLPLQSTVPVRQELWEDQLLLIKPLVP